MINLELSQQLSKAVEARAGRCYDNARRALHDQFQDALYIEGFAVPDNGTQMSFEHAWLEVDGQIVDPTWCGLSLQRPETPHRSGPIYDQPILALAYFPVLKLSCTQLDEILPKAVGAWGWSADWLIWALNDPTDGLFTDDQRQQFQTARQQAEEFLERRETAIE